jgi:hypothetical protein
MTEPVLESESVEATLLCLGLVRYIWQIMQLKPRYALPVPGRNIIIEIHIDILKGCTFL